MNAIMSTKTLYASQPGVENQLRHSRRGLNLGLQNVRLRRKQPAELQLIRAHLVGDCVRRFDEHFIRYAVSVCGVNDLPDRRKA
jgi:hypothetical protein